MMKKPVIGITLGDAAGIGPEIIVKALANPEIYEISRPLVIGDEEVLKAESRKQKIEIGTIDVLDSNNTELKNWEPGKPSLLTARAAVKYIKQAVQLTKQKKINAIVTAPLNKETVNKAGFKFSGHTQLLAQLTRTKLFRMMFVVGKLRVVLVTDHCPLKKVPLLLTQQRIFDTLKLIQRETKRFGITAPRIAVCGLNPHAGEGGYLGTEENKIILPAIKSAREAGINVRGLFPADTIFYRARNDEFDFVVAMFHDQGLIPLKTIAFAQGVNVTLGLPFVRTSVGHGTAYDIAGQGVADPTSMVEAIKLAVNLCNN